MVRRERERKVSVRGRAKIVPLTAEELDWLAMRAASADKVDLAVRLLRMAIRRQPQDARLHHDLAFYLARQEDLEGAVAAYAEAARRSDDGRAEFEAAVLRARDPAGAAEAGRLLARALEKEPWLVEEIGEAEWPPGFLDREEVRSAVARAEGATSEGP